MSSNDVKITLIYDKEPSEGKEVIKVKNSLQMHENVFSTGELSGIEKCIDGGAGKVIEI